MGNNKTIVKYYLCQMVNEDVLALVNKGLMLPLMEEFYTIQGEGYHKGTAAYFIRIGGCDVGCHWCDVKESWNADLHPPTHNFIQKYVDVQNEAVGEYSDLLNALCLINPDNKLDLLYFEQTYF